MYTVSCTVHSFQCTGKGIFLCVGYEDSLTLWQIASHEGVTGHTGETAGGRYVGNMESSKYQETEYLWIPELLKVADVQTHVCAVFSRICPKLFWLLNEKKTRIKHAFFLVILALFYKVLYSFTYFYVILSAFHFGKISIRNSASTKGLMNSSQYQSI